MIFLYMYIFEEYMNDQMAKSCAKDDSGFSYIKLNTVVKVFYFISITIALLVFLFMPYYFKESQKIGYILLGCALCCLFLSMRILLMSYKLTDKELVYGSFIKKKVTYSELINNAKKNPPYINSQKNVVISVDDNHVINLPMYSYCGSKEFVFQLEGKLSVLINHGTARTIKKTSVIRIFVGIAILILMFFLTKSL